MTLGRKGTAGRSRGQSETGVGGVVILLTQNKEHFSPTSSLFFFFFFAPSFIPSNYPPNWERSMSRLYIATLLI